jgi:hypothetical protein
MIATVTPKTVTRVSVAAIVRTTEKAPVTPPVRRGLLAALLRALSAFAG